MAKVPLARLVTTDELDKRQDTSEGRLDGLDAALAARGKGQVHEVRRTTTFSAAASSTGETLLIDSTFTVEAGRRYRVTVHVPQLYGTDGDRGLLRIYAGGTGAEIAAAYFRLEPSGDMRTIVANFVATGAATVPVRLGMTRDTGTGTWTMWCSGSAPLLVVVDDVGPA